MDPIAIIMMVLFIFIIWGGLVASIVKLSDTDDDVTGEIGSGPGTDNDSLAAIQNG